MSVFPNNIDDLVNLIIHQRPNLSDGSIKTYKHLLNSLYRNACNQQPWYNPHHIDISKFNDFHLMNTVLKHMKYSSRKTVLSALFVITNNPEYRKLMLDDIKTYNQEIEKQEKTETQKNNWITPEEILIRFHDLQDQANQIYASKNYSIKNLIIVQNYVIVALLGGIFIPPRRLKDYVEFKIRNIDKDIDNYLKGSTLVFNQYKTKKIYGTQVVKIPNTLKTILTKYIKINPTDYLLFDTNLHKLKHTMLTQRLNNIFMGNISANQLRHSYLTDKFSNFSKEQKHLEDTMVKMGSSTRQLTNYVKL